VENIKNVFFNTMHSGLTIINCNNLSMLIGKLDVGLIFELILRNEARWRGAGVGAGRFGDNWIRRFGVWCPQWFLTFL
jgi:hypothetical protein